MTVYDTNGVFAESPVSTGMKGHSTPMGVFSVIQKHKFHHSNIYSGAPMPYMQRITWSGVAMHAGVLPGYPASHGCIRMPMAFAVKMWNWTKMGARVIVSPGEMTPHSFQHPLLASVRVPPQPAASLEPQTNVGDKSDKGAAPKAAEGKPQETRTASADAVLELRSSVGHTVMSDVTTGNAPAREDAAATAGKVDASAKSEMKTAEATDAAKPANAESKPNDAAEAPKAPRPPTTRSRRPRATRQSLTRQSPRRRRPRLRRLKLPIPPGSPMRRLPRPTPRRTRRASPIPRRRQSRTPPSGPARSPSSSAARIPSSMCGRTSRRCSRRP